MRTWFLTTAICVVLTGCAKKPVSVEDGTQQNQGQLTYCYEERLKENPELEGRIEVAWSIRAGTVSNVRIVDDSTGDQALQACVVRKISRWRFDSEVSDDVTWPFVFRRR